MWKHIKVGLTSIWSCRPDEATTATATISEKRHRLQPTPCWATAQYTPEKHAAALLRWVLEDGLTHVLASELRLMHQDMCLEYNWAVRPWNPVAREFTRLTTGRKVYSWVVCDGVRHRLRVYPIATPRPTPPRRGGSKAAKKIASGQHLRAGGTHDDTVSRPALKKRRDHDEAA